MAERLTFTEYCDLVVARLYEMELRGDLPTGSVVDFMDDFKRVVPAGMAMGGRQVPR
jgi:hypothetical protein